MSGETPPIFKHLNLFIMQYVTENITPGKAQNYLKVSGGNRPISKVTVRSYADTMRKGRWMLNGVPIIFDNEGRLIDGHHRLLAVVEAGIPVRFDVARGAAPEAFTTIDCGRHRNVGQLLAMQGVKHYNLIGSIIRANARLVQSDRLYQNNGSPNGKTYFTTNADDYDTYRSDVEGYDHVADVMVKFQSRCRLLASSWGGGIYYYLTHTGGYTEQEVFPFFDVLYNLEDNSIKPASLLRKVIAKEAIEGRKLQAETLWVYIVKAWNSYVTGTPLKILRYRKEIEDVPCLITK